jgi:hypothetical protein
MTCHYCEVNNSTYSLACLGCCRRLWKAHKPELRPAIVEMIEAYSPPEIVAKVQKGLSRG